MDNMSPQQQQEQQQASLSRGAAPQEHKRRLKSQSYRRQSAPSLVITKALTRSKTLSRESFLVPVCPESCPLVQSFLSASDRSFLLHGHVQLRTGMQTQDRHLFLFTDTLVIAKAKSANHFKQKCQVRVCEMWTASCMDEVCEGSTNPERSFVTGWPTCNYVATFSSSEQKEKWLSLLKSRIKEEKELEEPKTIPLRVYGKGINTFAVTKTLPVSNWDNSNEVIRLALQQFSIIGNVKDYQLWVISKRENAPYPLIGHEFPFSIQMSHVRHTASQTGGGGGGGGGKDAAVPPPDRQKAMQVEQLQASKQCQFILKPRPTEVLPVSADLPQKPFKRRRSLITWAFWRGSSPHLSELSAGGPRGCLFGQPLGCVCIEASLPKPVMDMLSFLYHEGSWTRGIFRRPAGARAVRELRDSLDSGHFHLPLTRDHIFIIAGVFKDFLRSIPGSLLCCELHEEWMDVLEEEEEEEEQVQDVKRMIGRLPREHGVLLRYLLAMLHAIQANAQENQMTSFNLSVCIAPSLLWPPGAPCSPEVEGEGTKKVCELVKFMIEHCEQILGEEPASLFGGLPQRPSSDETGSDCWLDPLTDSSYDSLENELDTSSGGSPGFCRRQLRASALQGSLDSILTFSDQDTEPACPGRSPDPSPVLSDCLSPGGRHRQRRRSEPAIAYVAKFGPCLSAGNDGLSGDEEPRMIYRGQNTLTLPGVKSSCSSLSSTSPAPTHSSLDSPDSLGSSEHAWAPRRGLHPGRTLLPCSPVPPAPPPPPPPPPPAEEPTCPKEAPNWGTLKGCRGLHPNSWLKKGRRLSLTQEDNLEKEDKTAGGSSDKPSKIISQKGKAASGSQAKLKASCNNKPQPPPQAKQASSSPPAHHRSTGSLHFPKSPWFLSSDSSSSSNHHHQESEAKQPSPALFYKQKGPTLSLFRQSKPQSVEEQSASRLYQRRGSEPGRQLVDRAATLTRARLPSDPGLEAGNADQSGGPGPGTSPTTTTATTDPRFCLSPYATKAVKDYFSAHPCSSPQSGQQVALALVESRREWVKRCSDATAEPDLEQLLFAEESYV